MVALFDPAERLVELELEVMERQREIDEIRRTHPYNFNLASDLNRRQARLLIKQAEIERLRTLIKNPESWS
jgi:hypothetical protein